MKKLPIEFYSHGHVTAIAKALLGKILVTKFDGIITSGRIVETEAYVALTDRASHSYGGKRTTRNEHMYASPGTTYVYICYGMHHLFNVVTNKKGVPDAVLIRAVEPLQGIEDMLIRTGKKKLDHTLTRGPGNMSKALGISKQHSGLNILKNDIHIVDDGFTYDESSIATGKRIGIDGAGEDALLPYRFYVRGNKFVSAVRT